MWEWEECNNFYVASGSTQILPSRLALKLAWGEHYDSNIISNTPNARVENAPVAPAKERELRL